MDDREMIERALARDPAAEHALFHAHAARVHRVIFRMTGDPDLADEYLQDTFVRAFERLSTFRFEAKLSTWLDRIAVTVTLNGLERVRRRRRMETELVADLPRAECSDPTSPVLIERIGSALRELPDTSRAVLALYVEGYSHEEIAGVVGLSVAASKTRLSRARAHLRERLPDVLEELRR